MKITWSVPVPGEALDAGRGDLVRASNLIDAVRDAGHEVVVVHAGTRPGTAAAVATYRSVFRRMLPRPVAVALRDLGRAAHARAHARRVASVARQQGADVIIETQVHLCDSGATAARACGVPLLLDDCSPASEEQALASGEGLGNLARFMFLKQARAAGALTVSSFALQSRLVGEGVPRDKISVIANGVDPACYGANHREVTRDELGLGSEPTLVFVGSFQPWHHVELLVESLARLMPTPRLLLAGDGPGLAPALARARSLGVCDRIVTLGRLQQTRIPPVLAAGDIGVLPESNEYGQPMKLLEYAAAGLAIVAPDLPPVRAIIDDGVTGLLFPPGDVAGLTRAIDRLLRDSATRTGLGVQARRRIAGTAGWAERGRELAGAAARILRPVQVTAS
jgi:glycosyltransferase involved in cell wall biosynthesis